MLRRMKSAAPATHRNARVRIQFDQVFFQCVDLPVALVEKLRKPFAELNQLWHDFRAGTSYPWHVRSICLCIFVPSAEATSPSDFQSDKSPL